MTRARKELYLFSCKGESSEFLDEINKNLPIEYTDSNDIFFSLFARDMLGRVYCDSKNGRGIIIACCAEKLCIRYTSGKTELKTLAEMLTDRDRTVTYIKSEELEKLNVTAEKPIPKKAGNISLKAGDMIYHSSFGNGVIKNIDKAGIGTVYFESNGETKRLMLKACLDKGIIVLS